MKLFNPILDTMYLHNDDIKVIGKPQPIPTSEAYSHITEKMEPVGGHMSSATIRGQHLNSVNLVQVDTESTARRNIGYIRENIAVRKAHEEKLCQVNSPKDKN